MTTWTSVETSLAPPQTIQSMRVNKRRKAGGVSSVKKRKTWRDKMMERYGDPEEEVADDRIKEMWEESDEEESDEEKGHGSEESSEEEDEDEE